MTAPSPRVAGRPGAVPRRDEGGGAALRPFSLVPFPGERPPPRLSLSGAIGRRAGRLSFRLALSGDLSAVSIPPAAGRGERKDRLWEETCLELFLAEEGREGYLELNFSPAGHWNAYRFDAVRTGMREERAFPPLPFRLDREEGSVALSLALPLAGLFPPERPLAAAAAAVVRSKDGGTTHWALAHPASRPDFHHRASFLLLLPLP